MTIEYKNQAIELAKLTASTCNVRQMGRQKGVKALADQIAAQGLIQPLTVYKAGAVYEVDAGRRRLAAIHLLAERGDWGDKVPCRVIPASTDAQDRKAISFAENAGQLPMHPLDRLRVISGFVRKGMSAAEVAARFGLTEKDVSDTLKLNGLALPVRAAAARGELDLSKALAYATCDDQTIQSKVFKRFGVHGNARSIRSALRNWQGFDSDTMTEDSRFFGFVADAYEDAGGTFESDLFTADGARKVNGTMVMDLAREKLDNAARFEQGENGWAWVETSLHERPRFKGYRWDDNPEDAPVPLGGIVWIDYDGDLRVDGPIVRAADYEAWEEAERASAEDGTDDMDLPDAASAAEPLEAEPEVDPDTLPKEPSRPMLQDAGRALTEALQGALSQDIGAAFDLLLARMLAEFRHEVCKSSVLPRMHYIDPHPALEAAVEDALPDIGAGEMTARALVDQMDTATKQRLFAALVAGQIDATAKDWQNMPEPKAKADAVDLAQRLGVSMHEAWSDDDRREYLGRMTKRDLCAHVLRLNEDDAAEAMSANDKDALVDRAMGEVWVPPYFEGADALPEARQIAAE